MIDFLATDHPPCPPPLKCREAGDFPRAWGGIASLELSLAAVWTTARPRGCGIELLAAWLCQGGARLAGLEARKEAIAPGADADLVVWNPEASFRVEPARLQQRHKLTPYAGRTLSGRVQATFLRGRKIYENGSFTEGPSGAILRRGHT